MKKEEIEKLKEQTKLELLYGVPLMQTEIDQKGMHKMTIQTVCNPKILLKLIESYERSLNVIINLICDENYISGNKAHERAHEFLRSIE